MEWYLAVAFALIGCGVVLLVAEFFLPTGGVVVVGAIAAFAVAVGVVFNYGTTSEGIATSIAVSVGLPVAGAVMFYGWQRLSLQPHIAADGGAANGDDPFIAGLAKLRGRYGRTVSAMRPAGTVEIEGRRVDAMSEGRMIDADVWVRCVDVRGGTVVVRQADAPGGLDDIDLGDLS